MIQYNIETGCGGGIRRVYVTPDNYLPTVATGIHTYIVEAEDPEDAVSVLRDYYNPNLICSVYEWHNYPQPLRRKYNG